MSLAQSAEVPSGPALGKVQLWRSLRLRRQLLAHISVGRKQRFSSLPFLFCSSETLALGVDLPIYRRGLCY